MLFLTSNHRSVQFLYLAARIEAGHAQKKGKGKERNWKDEEIEMLITLYEERPCLWEVGHKDYVNRDIKEVACSQIDLMMSNKYDISREDYKSNGKLSGLNL